jgi:hypothetical protein
VTRDRTRRTIKLTQQRLALELVERYGLGDKANKRSLPLDPSTSFVPAEEHELLDTRTYTYSALVGSLLYLSVCTRPDLSQSVGALARYMARPGEQHWKAAKGVLRYLSGTLAMGLKWHPEHTNRRSLLGYCDANYQGCKTTLRSTTGYVFLLWNAAISWRSQLQKTVALSTAESEYMAACSATKEAMALKQQLELDFGFAPAPVELLGDNQAAIQIAKNPVSTERTRHIAVRYHYVRERVAEGSVNFSHVPTAHMVADLLTKPLPAPAFCAGRLAMGVV